MDRVPLTAVGAQLDLADGDLGPEALAGVALAISRQPDLWAPFVVHDPSERQYESLYADERIGIWVICWMPGQDTGFHDHDRSCGGVAVAMGSIYEERPVWSGPPRRVNPGAGETVCFDETEIHRMANVSDEPAVTIHAYSPPLARMGSYALDADGYVRRLPVDWDHRLVPPLLRTRPLIPE
jgi:predicted metal-dependent enzyme (double-stranded beta helix superfamily)